MFQIERKDNSHSLNSSLRLNHHKKRKTNGFHSNDDSCDLTQPISVSRSLRHTKYCTSGGAEIIQVQRTSYQQNAHNYPSPSARSANYHISQHHARPQVVPNKELDRRPSRRTAFYTAKNEPVMVPNKSSAVTCLVHSVRLPSKSEKDKSFARKSKLNNSDRNLQPPKKIVPVVTAVSASPPTPRRRLPFEDEFWNNYGSDNDPTNYANQRYRGRRIYRDDDDYGNERSLYYDDFSRMPSNEPLYVDFTATRLRRDESESNCVAVSIDDGGKNSSSSSSSGGRSEPKKRVKININDNKVVNDSQEPFMYVTIASWVPKCNRPPMLTPTMSRTTTSVATLEYAKSQPV